MTPQELDALKQLESEGFFTCFRTGVWEDSQGKKHNITAGDLDNLVIGFGKAGDVPLVIGHDGKTEEGKIEKISRFGDYLLAKARDISGNILEKIKTGIFRFVSIAFNKDMEMEHIALTNAPCVDGLLPITPAFAKFSQEAIIFHFEKITPKINHLEIKEVKQMPEEKKDKQEGKENTENPPATAAAVTAEFEKKLTTAEKEKAEALKKAEEAEKKLAEFAKKQKAEGIATFTTQLLNQGKLFPNEVEPMNNFLCQLDEETLHQFSKDTNKTQTQYIKDFLTGLPKRIPLDKIDPGKKAPGTNACFSRINPDEEDLNLHEAAAALAKKENIPYLAALTRLDMEQRR